MPEYSPGPVSVIVLTWNGLDITRNCVTTLLERTTHPDFEVVVVDNGSTDGTLDYLRSVQGIWLIENGENLGFVRGNNVGIRATAADVVLLNNDTEIIQPDWLEKIQELARSADDIGLVGCRLTDAEGWLIHAGTYMPTPSFWGQEYPAGEKDISQYERDREVEGVIAACVYIKREVIDAVGALDEQYFSYYEDTDYCLKAKQAGYRVFCCGSATVRHIENASTDVNRMDFSGTFKRSRQIFMANWKDYYEGRYTHAITWRSYISGEDRFSRLSAGFLHALDRAGVEANLAFLEGAEKAELDDFLLNDMKNRGTDRARPQVAFAPPELVGTADGSYNISYTFTPYDRFTDSWVKDLNRADEVWVTSEFQRKAAVASGVKKEVTVVPPGVDPDYFNPGIQSFALSNRFVFLASGGWGPDQAWETLLGAFTDEFAADEDAVLVLAVTSPEPGAEVEHAVEAMNLPLDRAPVVFVVDQEVPPYQEGSLFRSADCLVSVERSSENAITAVKGLACGVPVIVPGWGSATELVDETACLGLDHTLVGSPVEGTLWAEPDRGHLRALMRGLKENKEAARAAALEASARLAGSRDWDATVKKIIERLDEVPRK